MQDLRAERIGNIARKAFMQRGRRAHLILVDLADFAEMELGNVLLCHPLGRRQWLALPRRAK
jgi:hypothetical protein